MNRPTIGRILAMRCAWLTVGFVLSANIAQANNITVTNVTLAPVPGTAAMDVQFDLSWSNSWRASWREGAASVTNWDAAWVFIKYRVKSGGADTNWHHAYLAPGGHSAPPGSTIDVGTLPANGGKANVNTGVFIYRSTTGSGSLNLSKVKLRWDYAAQGPVSLIDVSVHAVEMVYIPPGGFYLGSGGSWGHFYQYTDGSQDMNLVLVSKESSAFAIGTSNGNVYYDNANSTHGDQIGIISSEFPKGYAAFYCMKNPITQREYREFLDELTARQADFRFPGNAGTDRQPVESWVYGVTNAAPDNAANWLSWADVAAYADWAGLRPMSELEFEKAFRIPTAEKGGLKMASTAAGAGCYYGVTELGGILWERTVTVGHPKGRAFTGMHGDGVLDAIGNADVINWPGADALGAGFRGGRWNEWDNTTKYITSTADRSHAATKYRFRLHRFVGRAVRSAP